VSDTDDRQAITDLLFRWAHARDYGDWDALLGCFHDDAVMRINFAQGPVRDYVERALKDIGDRGGRYLSKHLVNNPLIEIKGDRATSVIHATLHVRRMVGGIEADLESWMRFFDLLERRAGRWGIVKRTGVYEKDRMSAVDPAGFPPGFWDGIELAQFPPAKRFLAFAQVKNGGAPRFDFVSAFTPEEDAVKQEARAWLG
jgi:hypothetical protein